MQELFISCDCDCELLSNIIKGSFHFENDGINDFANFRIDV